MVQLRIIPDQQHALPVIQSAIAAKVKRIEDRWFQVTLPVGAGNKKARGGKINSDFDPSHIVAVGLKVGTGGGSQTVYNGPIYIDAVNW